jgi:hypothetical protein
MLTMNGLPIVLSQTASNVPEGRSSDQCLTNIRRSSVTATAYHEAGHAEVSGIRSVLKAARPAGCRSMMFAPPDWML